MPIRFPPVPGQVLVCNYNTGFKPGEMVKERLLVVVSPRLPYRDDLCTVVPLSTTPPRSGIHYQCKVFLPFPAPPPFEGEFKFAKADMLSTVGYNRLNMPFTGKDGMGKRKYVKLILAQEELAKLRRCMLFALGLDILTKEL